MGCCCGIIGNWGMAGGVETAMAGGMDWFGNGHENGTGLTRFYDFFANWQLHSENYSSTGLINIKVNHTKLRNIK